MQEATLEQCASAKREQKSQASSMRELSGISHLTIWYSTAHRQLRNAAEAVHAFAYSLACDVRNRLLLLGLGAPMPVWYLVNS